MGEYLHSVWARIATLDSIGYLFMAFMGFLLLAGMYIYTEGVKIAKKKLHPWQIAFISINQLGSVIMLGSALAFFLIGGNLITSEYLPNISASLMSLSLALIILHLLISFGKSFTKSPKILVLLVLIFLLSFASIFGAFCSPSSKCGLLGTFLYSIFDLIGLVLNNIEKVALALFVVFTFYKAIQWIYRKNKQLKG